jgi:hypothetical protein
MHVPAVVASVGRTAVWEDEIDTLTRADDRERDGDDAVVGWCTTKWVAAAWYLPWTPSSRRRPIWLLWSKCLDEDRAPQRHGGAMSRLKSRRWSNSPPATVRQGRRPPSKCWATVGKAERGAGRAPRWRPPLRGDPSLGHGRRQRRRPWQRVSTWPLYPSLLPLYPRVIARWIDVRAHPRGPPLLGAPPSMRLFPTPAARFLLADGVVVLGGGGAAQRKGNPDPEFRSSRRRC